MSIPNIRIGQLQGGKTKKTYQVYWNPETKKVFVSKPAGFFGSPSLIDTKGITGSAEMAMHAAEGYLYDK